MLRLYRKQINLIKDKLYKCQEKVTFKDKLFSKIKHMHYHNNLDIKIKHNIDKSFQIDYHLASNNNNHTSKYMNTQNPL